MNSFPTKQLEAWKGLFGDEYVNRNAYADWKVKEGAKAFRTILDENEVSSILEVGSNIGLNLIYLNELFKKNVDLYAIEPNEKAFRKLTKENPVKIKKAWNCDAFNLPLKESSVDLVFTAGVLIHIAPDDLGRITDEIIRVSKRYVLCIEYFSRDPVEVAYRGQRGLLYKRDFGSYYLDRFPELYCAKYGFLWQRDFQVFDSPNWWLFEKKP